MPRRNMTLSGGATALTAPRPITPEGISSANIAGTAGWKAAGHGQSRTEQIGAFDGGPLNQYPVNLPGVQRWCGVENLNSSWYTPVVSVVPQGTTQQTQQGAPTQRLAGVQRNAQRFTGPIGPVTARIYQKRVTAASIDQSALASEDWANIAAGAQRTD